MEVYGDMEDMVNKTLLFMAGHKEYAWEPATSRLARLLALDAQTAVVAGSHIGYYPLILSEAHPSLVVHAFEPNPKNFERLVRNISINNAEQIQPYAAALGDVSGEQHMFFDFGQSSFVDSGRAHAGEGRVLVQTLDELFAKGVAGTVGATMPDLMIFDAEGFESHILRGGQKTIHAHKPHIIFEINPKALAAAGSSAEELCGYLAKEGYSVFIIEDDYSHSFSKESGTEIRLSPYSDERVSNVSFVNAFATMEPNRFKTYIQNS